MDPRRLATLASFLVAAFATACGSNVTGGTGGTNGGSGGSGGATCPAALPALGAPCAAEGQNCTYFAETCEEAGGTVTCTGGVWAKGNGYYPGCSSSCPADPPPPGTSCTDCCGHLCLYPADLGCNEEYTCQYSTWTYLYTTCPPCASLADASLCAARSDCRWLVHAACPTTPQTFQEGCYPATPCASDDECPIGTPCLTVQINPCPANTCDACSATTQVCAP